MNTPFRGQRESETYLDEVNNLGRGQEKAREAIEHQISRGEKSLDIRALDLHNLDFMLNIKWNLLQEIDISNNLINTIDILYNYQNLKVLRAQKCFIVEVNLKLPKLEILDLKNNQIKSFPILSDMQNLRVLDLSANQLSEFKQFNVQLTLGITTLDIANNPTLKFSQKRDFVMLLNKLKKLKLQELDIDTNHIGQYNGMEEIIKQLPHLTQINGVEKDTMQRKMERAKQHGQEDAILLTVQENEEEDGDAQRADEGEYSQKKAKAQIPTLNTLNQSLEAANSHPSMALVYLKQLSKDADRVIDKLEEVEMNFASDMSENQIEESIETFMQNSQLLIDNHFELQSIMLTVLSKLCIVRFFNFGLHCFNTLKDLMKSGREIESQVINYLKIEVINKMNQNDPRVIPVSLLKGLFNLINETGMSNLLTGMYQTSFPKWLRQIDDEVDGYRTRKNENMPNNDHYDSIIKLLSVSVSDEKNNENAIRFVEKDLCKYIIKIIKNSSQKDNRYIPCLNLIANLSSAIPDGADQFMDGNIHSGLIGQIKSSMNTYKVNQSLYTENSKESIDSQLLKYKTLAAEIIAIGALLQSKRSENRQKIRGDSISYELIQIMSHQKTDPILLSAVCRFALHFFKTEEVRKDPSFMEPFFIATSSMRQLVPYLGFEKYGDLISMTEKYHTHNKFHVQHQQDDSKSEESSGAGSIDEGEIINQRQPVIHGQQLNFLNDPIIIELFIRLINLIEYFCREAVENQENKFFAVIAENLNANKREAALFNCLAVPDDGVRLAVVRCLFVVPEDQFDTEELFQLTKIIGQCTNIGAGQTELVLSTLYWIMTKFVQENPDKSKENVYKTFQIKFGDQVVTEALNILQRNLVRIPEVEEEDYEKYALSLSIINFLKASTESKYMKKHLKNKGDIFKKILINEDLYSSSMIRQTPIDIEFTLSGRDVSCLTDTISGFQKINPYGDVGARVLMRIADVLQNRHYLEPFKIDKAEKNVSEQLFKHQQNLYKKKKNQELQFWVDKPEDFQQSIKDTNDFALQHNNFTNGGIGIGLILVFLSARYTKCEEYIKELSNDQFDIIKQKYNDKSLLSSITKQLEKKQGVFRKNYMKENDEFCIRRQLIKEIKQKDNFNNLSILDRVGSSFQNKFARDNTLAINQDFYRNCMQDEDLGNDITQFHLKDDQIEDKQKRESNLINDHMQNIKDGQFNNSNQEIRNKRGDGFLNSKIRILTVSALLRIIYSTIEYAPTMKLKLIAINNLKNPDNFSKITQLCETCNWDEEANIGGKYLRVMRHVLKMPLQQDRELNGNLIFYQMTAVVIQKILSKIIDKMMKDIHLNDNDFVTVYELSYIMNLIINQANNFSFSSLDLVSLHRLNEQRISFYQGSEKYLPDCLRDPSEVGAYLKCQNQGYVNTKPLKVESFNVEMPEIMKKRSIQEKVVEFMVLKLFTKKSIFSLVDILFKDMFDDFKALVDDEDQKEESEEDTTGVIIEEQQQLEEQDEDPTRYGVDVQTYMDRKRLLTIERIKDIVGEIMNTCTKNMNYDILEYIMRGVVFHKKKLRESFLQEILNAQSSASFSNALEIYINQQGITIYDKYKKFAKGDKLKQFEDRYERIIQFCQMDINRTLINFNMLDRDDKRVIESNDAMRNKNFVNRLFVVTNQGIQIMRMPAHDVTCSKCQPQMFCPVGPTPVFQVKYEDVQQIIRFPQIPQKLVIRYRTSIGFQYQMTLNIPTFTMSAKIFKSISGILEQVDMQKHRQQHTNLQQSMNDDINNTPTPNQETKSSVQQTDIKVQHSLVELFQKIKDEELFGKNAKFRKKDVKNVELICASLQKNTILPDEILSLVHSPKPHQINCQFSQNYEYASELKRYIESSKVTKREVENVIQSPVYIAICGMCVVILKEKWENWKLNKLENIKKLQKQQMNTFTPGQTPGSTPGAGDATPNGSMQSILDSLKKKNNAEPDRRRKRAVDAYNGLKSDLFSVLTILHIEDILKLNIHKDKDPSVDLICFSMEQKDNKFGPQMHKIQILFPGDMERQRLVEKLVALNSKLNCKDEDDVSEEDQANSDSDYGSNEDKKSKDRIDSDEEPQMAIIYD